MKTVLGMPFFPLSNADMGFAEHINMAGTVLDVQYEVLEGGKLNTAVVGP